MIVIAADNQDIFHEAEETEHLNPRRYFQLGEITIIAIANRTGWYHPFREARRGKKPVVLVCEAEGKIAAYIKAETENWDMGKWIEKEGQQ